MSFIRSEQLYGYYSQGKEYVLYVYDWKAQIKTKYAFEMIHVLESIGKAHGMFVPFKTYQNLKELERIYGEDTDFNKAPQSLYGTREEQEAIFAESVKQAEYVENERIKSLAGIDVG